MPWQCSHTYGYLKPPTPEQYEVCEQLRSNRAASERLYPRATLSVRPPATLGEMASTQRDLSPSPAGIDPER